MTFGKVICSYKISLIFIPCRVQIFLTIFSITSYLITFFLIFFKIKHKLQKKINYKTQENNQNIYKSKSCRAAELSKFFTFSVERKAGLASIAEGCLGGSLTGVLVSENYSTSPMVFGFSPQIPLPKEKENCQGKRKMIYRVRSV